MTTIEHKQQAAYEAYENREATSTLSMKVAFVNGAEWAESQVNWYKISEREPKPGEHILIVTDDYETYMGFVDIRKHCIWLGPQGISREYILHYTVIPVPPAQEGVQNRSTEEVDSQKENLKLHMQIHQLQTRLDQRDEQVKSLLATMGELQDALIQQLVKPIKRKGGRENEEGEQTTDNPPAQ